MKWPEEKNNLARRFRISFSSRKKKRNRSIEGAYRQDRRQSGSYGQGPDKRAYRQGARLDPHGR